MKIFYDASQKIINFYKKRNILIYKYTNNKISTISCNFSHTIRYKYITYFMSHNVSSLF